MTSDAFDGIPRSYEDAVAWIESFIRPITGTAPQKTQQAWQSDGPGRLARMEALLEAVGHPERAYSTLHVTGTSGKGSVCTYIGSMLRTLGHKVGVHATPYLQTPLEKLQVDGRYASPADLVDLVDAFTAVLPRGRDQVDGLPYPALWVALTYLYFARRQVEFAVIEASTGGRYDWTNTIVPAVSVITTVGPDHLSTLGPTLADVAFHKAGIIKPGGSAVTGVRPPELRIIEEEAARQGSRLFRLGVDFDLAVRRCTETGTVFDFVDHAHGWALSGLETGMVGRYQAFNAALALAAIRAWSEDRGSAPDESAVREGLRLARLPGRMEFIQRDPDVMLDGAHNPEKAAALAESLAEIFPERRLILVFGALSTKDAAGVLAPFQGQARHAIVTVPHVLGKPGLDPERLAQAAAGLSIPVSVENDPIVAMRTAMSMADATDLICVTGSLYLVGEVRRLWVSDETVTTTGYSSPDSGLLR